MGYETKCRVRVRDAAGVREAEAATVLLETDELIVRGEARVKVARAAITTMTARAGVLTIASPAATVSLTLGPDAATKWKARLEAAPRALIDKLDIKPEHKVWLWGVTDETLHAQLSERVGSRLTKRAASACDVVFVAIETSDDLPRLERAARAIVADGAIWAVHPKGKHGVADTAIYAKAKALGLTFTKVARVSDTHTAEKLVWPRATRATRSSAG